MARQKKIIEEINDFEDKFLSIYMQNGFNATGAYVLAKPNVSYDAARTEASKLIQKPHIQKELEIRKLALRNKENIELSFLVQNLKTVIYDCMQENTERDQDGRITSKPDRQNLIKSIDILAKLGGHYTNKIDVTTNGENINQITWVEQKTYPNKLND
jgi:phage terminase small subunit